MIERHHYYYVKFPVVMVPPFRQKTVLISELRVVVMVAVMMVLVERFQYYCLPEGMMNSRLSFREKVMGKRITYR